MKPNDMPLICLPLGLCDDDAATLIEFLYDLTEALERVTTTDSSCVALTCGPIHHPTNPTLRSADPPF